MGILKYIRGIIMHGYIAYSTKLENIIHRYIIESNNNSIANYSEKIIAYVISSVLSDLPLPPIVTTNNTFDIICNQSFLDILTLFYQNKLLVNNNYIYPFPIDGIHTKRLFLFKDLNMSSQSYFLSRKIYVINISNISSPQQYEFLKNLYTPKLFSIENYKI